MKKIVSLFVSICLMIIGLNAQQVSGVVKDPQGKGLEKSTVSLLNSKDSTVVKLSVTTDNGRYTILAAKPGTYLVKASHVGYVSTFSNLFEVSGSGETAVPELTMARAAGELKAVTVTAEKPVVEVRNDKMVVNVEGTINAVGSDALELLRKSPGVMVDKDDNLTLSGKNGVKIYVDGKPSPLTGSDLSNYLKTLQSTQIESLEIITNPSARYDAAGNAGIINIRLKKNKTMGTNGSVNVGYNQGYTPKYNGGISLNHRNKNINLFGNYNYNHGTNRGLMVFSKEQFDTLFDQRNTIHFGNESHGFKTGMDYFINKNNTIGVMFNGDIAKNHFTTQGPMYIIFEPTNTLDRILQATSDNVIKRTNINTNLNYRYAKTGGAELNVDADYGYFRIRSNQYQPNFYYEPDGVTEISRTIYNMIAPTNIDLYSVKADYDKPFKGGQLSVGAKTAIVNTDNDFQRYNVYGVSKVKDTLKSNKFLYKENINAVYVNFNKGFKGHMIQAGLRIEHTHSKGTSTGFKDNAGNFVPYDSSFNRSYVDFFPSAAVTFNKNPMKMWNFTYSRRIDRPAYQDLNPFEFKLNEYTFMKGNTLLRPQYTNSYGVTYTYHYKLNTTLNYSHVKDIFAQLPDTTEKTKSFLTKKNLATQDIVSLNVSYPFQYKWYSFFVNVNTYYSHYIADFGPGNRRIDQGVFALTYYMQNSAKLGKGWTAELSGFFSSPSLWQGVFKSKALGSIDAGFQKTLFKGKATAKASVSDIFKTLKWSGTSNFAGVNNVAHGNFESRQLKLNFIYRFGSNQVKSARQRNTGLDDEKKRANSNGGQQQGGINQ